MPWNDFPMDSITVPSNALPSEPRVYIGDDDPIIELFTPAGLAGITFYATEDVGLAMTVENDVADPLTDPAYLDFNIQAADLTDPLVYHQLGGMSLNTATNVSGCAWGDAGAQGYGSGHEAYADVIGTDVSIYAYNGAGNPGEGGVVIIGGPNPGGSPIDRSDLQIFGTSAARGKFDEVSSNAPSGAIAAAETVVLTMASRRYYAGRAYEMRLIAGAQTSVAGANATAFCRFRKTNVAGQDLGSIFRFSAPTTTQVYPTQGVRVFTVGDTADVTAVIVNCLVFTGGATGVQYADANSARIFEIFDCGAASDFPSAPVLV